MVAQFSTGILAHFSISIYTHYRPKRHETYFTIYFCDYITGFGVIADEWWDNPGTDEIRLKAGHVFRTEAEAQSFCEKINNLLKERRP